MNCHFTIPSFCCGDEPRDKVNWNQCSCLPTGPPSISDYPSPPPTLQAAVIQEDTSSSHHLLPHPEAGNTL